MLYNLCMCSVGFVGVLEKAKRTAKKGNTTQQTTPYHHRYVTWQRRETGENLITSITRWHIILHNKNLKRKKLFYCVLLSLSAYVYVTGTSRHNIILCWLTSIFQLKLLHKLPSYLLVALALLLLLETMMMMMRGNITWLQGEDNGLIITPYHRNSTHILHNSSNTKLHYFLF